MQGDCWIVMLAGVGVPKNQLAVALPQASRPIALSVPVKVLSICRPNLAVAP